MSDDISALSLWLIPVSTNRMKRCWRSVLRSIWPESNRRSRDTRHLKSMLRRNSTSMLRLKGNLFQQTKFLYFGIWCVVIYKTCANFSHSLSHSGPMRKSPRCVQRQAQSTWRSPPLWGRSRWRMSLWNKLCCRRSEASSSLTSSVYMDALINIIIFFVILQQNQEIEELTKICDELIAKMGKIDWETIPVDQLLPSLCPANSDALCMPPAKKQLLFPVLSPESQRLLCTNL